MAEVAADGVQIVINHCKQTELLVKQHNRNKRSATAEALHPCLLSLHFTTYINKTGVKEGTLERNFS